MESLIDGLAEVRRERLVRQSVYPRLVLNGKLTQAEADRRLNALKWAEAYLNRLVQHWDHFVKISDGLKSSADPRME